MRTAFLWNESIRSVTATHISEECTASRPLSIISQKTVIFSHHSIKNLAKNAWYLFRK